jgi:beta-alanine--pyruvate transaminase
MGTRDQELLQQLNLEPLWIPFTANRQFKAQPRLLVAAKDMYYTAHDGRQILDGISGLWAVNAGHCRQPIVDAIKKQAESLDYATGFQMHSPGAFLAADRLVQITPKGMDHVFFVNSGSESVDTALKIALGYHRMKGEAARTRFIGRERGYHGVGFGGISVGGMVANRKMFPSVELPGVDHLPHTHNPAEMAFSRGMPKWGAHLADELGRLVALHDASTIAAVIVEPMQGSAGVIVPPVGYLQKLRELCTKHGILLIFDEVITGFGRMGAAFGADRLGVVPDMITFAKSVNNGVVPLGGVIVRKEIYEAFMTGPEHAVEFFHGYTYSGHPMAVAAAHATLDVLEEEGVFARVRALEEAMHSLKGERGVLDIRNCGLAAAVDLEPVADRPGLRALQVFEQALALGQLPRFTGDTIAVGPPFISTEAEIAKMADDLRKAIRASY